MTDTTADQISALIFNQLLESERFRMFFEMNFEVRKVVDDEAKTIDYVVIEKPPEMVATTIEALLGKDKEEEPLIQLEEKPKFKKPIKKLIS